MSLQEVPMIVHRTSTSRHAARVGVVAITIGLLAASTADAAPTAPITPVARRASFSPAEHHEIVGGSPYPVAIGDFNGDGHNDIAVGSEDDDLVNVLYGSESGFGAARQFDAGLYPFGIVAADFNGDGRDDMGVVDYDGGTISVLRAKATGFRAAVAYNTGGAGTGDLPVAAATGDLNRDGRIDIVVANGGTGTVGILFGAAGGFLPVTTRNVGGPDADTVDVIVRDVDHDRKADIVVLNQQTPSGTSPGQIAVLRGRGVGGFRAAVFSDAGTGSSYGFVAGRFDRGRSTDLVLSDCSGGASISLLRGRDDGTFRAPVTYPSLQGSCGYEPGAADFNGDGRLDVVNMSNSTGKVAISYQLGTSGFGPPQVLTAVEEAYSVGVGLLDDDNRPDIVVPDFLNPDVAVLYNLG